MRLIPVLLQIFALAAGFSSNRAEAMYGGAAFAVLTVVIYALTASRRETRYSSTRQLKTNRSHP